MKEKKENKISQILNIYSFIRFKTPYYLTLIILYGLIFYLFYQKDIKSLYIVILTIIGITCTISQTLFSYASILKEKEALKIVKNAGEHFLAASLWMSIVLLIFFVSTKIDLTIKNKNWYFEILSISFYCLSLLYFTYSADSINKGLHKINYFLWWQLDI